MEGLGAAATEPSCPPTETDSAATGPIAQSAEAPTTTIAVAAIAPTGQTGEVGFMARLLATATAFTVARPESTKTMAGLSQGQKGEAPSTGR